MTIKPTIGRIVHYTTVDGQKWPAIIVEVNLPGFIEDTVSLAVFQPGSSTICPERFVGYNEDGAYGTWRWPPREG